MGTLPPLSFVVGAGTLSLTIILLYRVIPKDSAQSIIKTGIPHSNRFGWYGGYKYNIVTEA